MSFATSQFETKNEICDVPSSERIILPLKEAADVVCGKLEMHSPSELFDRELYMTTSFHPSRVVKPESLPPKKLRSLKRCILLPPLTLVHESILFSAIRTAPTKWCYAVHLLHGGGAVNRVQPTKTAFGCRNWSFAAVITARWPAEWLGWL